MKREAEIKAPLFFCCIPKGAIIWLPLGWKTASLFYKVNNKRRKKNGKEIWRK